MKKGKVVLVGTGFVGMSMAYSMLNRGGIEELVLIDIDKDKTIGEEMDLSHGLPYAPQKMVIKAGDYEECKDAQVVVITAGIAQKPGQTRLELAEVNTKIMKQITQSIMASGFNGIIIVASNPGFKHFLITKNLKSIENAYFFCQIFLLSIAYIFV